MPQSVGSTFDAPFIVMTNVRLLHMLTLAASLVCASILHAAPEQPHMRAAIELLQAAKRSDKPLPMLHAAKKHIQNAKANKGGERREAVASINAAIAEATVGNKTKCISKINDAIANLHSGMDKAK
jgi:hypothetical protein